MKSQPEVRPEAAWVRTTPLCASLGINRITLWRWVRAGKFPRPVHLGSTRSLFFDTDEVARWIATQRRAAP